MIALNIECEVPISKGLWQKAIEHAVSLVGLANGSQTISSVFSVTFVDEKTITELAGKYRNDPRPTDVLSFSLDTAEAKTQNAAKQASGQKSTVPNAPKGEVIVCPEVILRNAEKFKVPFSEELLRVTVHGLLHLKEMDHEPFKFPLLSKGLKPEVLKSRSYIDAKKMFELQEGLVKQLRFDVFAPKLIVGLGNPGKKYANTRHNAGFLFAGILLRVVGAKLEVAYSSRSTELSEGVSKHGASYANFGAVHYALPQGGMNVSGRAVARLCEYLKIDPRESLLIVHDDLDLRLGERKLSYGKGRLHKGVEDVERSLKTSRFWRLRLGVDARDARNREEGKEYVLQNLGFEERKVLDKVLAEAARAIAENIRLVG